MPINVWYVMSMDRIGSARMGERQGEPLMVNFELFRWLGYMQVILSRLRYKLTAGFLRSGVLMAKPSCAAAPSRYRDECQGSG
jgi:hypothetical protein